MGKVESKKVDKTKKVGKIERWYPKPDKSAERDEKAGTWVVKGKLIRKPSKKRSRGDAE